MCDRHIITISVVIPLYNKSEYIVRALNSINKQKRAVEEIIIVDDASTDDSLSLVQRLSIANLRIIKLMQNCGASVARNIGIQEASSEYIAFLDADDEWHPEYIKKIEELIILYPQCGIYSTRRMDVYSGGRIKIANPCCRKNGTMSYFETLYAMDSIVQSSNAVVPKKILLELHGFPEGVSTSEDSVMWLKIGVDYPIALAKEYFSFYHRDIIGQVTQSAAGKWYQHYQPEYTQFVEWVLDGKKNKKLLQHIRRWYKTFLFWLLRYEGIDVIRTLNPIARFDVILPRIYYFVMQPQMYWLALFILGAHQAKEKLGKFFHVSL